MSIHFTDQMKEINSWKSKLQKWHVKKKKNWTILHNPLIYQNPIGKKMSKSCLFLWHTREEMILILNIFLKKWGKGETSQLILWSQHNVEKSKKYFTVKENYKPPNCIQYYITSILKLRIYSWIIQDWLKIH